jgi:transcriptional regulator with GAF, ATPase, and Fis domain
MGIATTMAGTNGAALRMRDRFEMFEQLFEQSAQMRDVKAIIQRVANSDATVLVLGESGVGKEVVSRLLHHRSARAGRPFIKVNCAALPLELLESELFGHERGAFTGAYQPKPGKFELAHTGTIFLDEIGEMPISVQAKLLQVLQDGEFSRLGGDRDVRVDARVIAATNKSLAALVRRGLFRADLYYRLNVVSIYVPPLRERRSEIPALAEYFMETYGGSGRVALSASTIERLMAYPWPGNVRELENFVRRAIMLGSETVALDHLRGPSAELRDEPQPEPPRPAPVSARELRGTLGLREATRKAAEAEERRLLTEVLEQCRWNRLTAARMLKISYKTLLTKIKRYRLAG